MQGSYGRLIAADPVDWRMNSASMFPLPQLARLFSGRQRQPPHPARGRVGHGGRNPGQDRRHIQGVHRCRRLWPLRRHGRIPGGFLIPNLLINLISESMNQALVPTLIRVREQRRPRPRPATAFELHALGVRAADRRIGRHGSHRARLFSADRLALSARETRSLDPAFLRPAARGADHRHRHQLHRRAEHLRPLRPARAGAGRATPVVDHCWARCC